MKTFYGKNETEVVSQENAGNVKNFHPWKVVVQVETINRFKRTKYLWKGQFFLRLKAMRARFFISDLNFSRRKKEEVNYEA